MKKVERSGRVAPLASARGVATIVLHRVATDAAYATRSLDAEIGAAGLDARDARLATEIVYGTLRMLPAIDALLDQKLSKGRPDPFTFAALRAASYQALALTRVPSFAIVQETVALVKQKRGEGLAKLTNAVLRRVVAERPEQPPREGLVLPEWVGECLQRALGEERAQRYVELGQAAPPLSLRVRKGLERRALLERLQAAEPSAELHESTLLEDSILAWGVGDPRKLPGYREGEFAVQDEGAELVGRLSDSQPGERVLDACAGHGGKTLQLLEQVGEGGHVTAIDLHARKLEQLTNELERYGYARSRVSCETVDLSVGAGGLAPEYDRVLVDAPCTGLGTLRRRPELLLRLTPHDPARMAALQLRILRTVASLVRPGGVLVYAVCSPSHEEGAAVAQAIEQQLPGLRRLHERVSSLPVEPDPDGVFRIGPWLSQEGGCPDLYQAVRWQVSTGA